MKAIMKIGLRIWAMSLMLMLFISVQAQERRSEYHRTKDRIERLQYQLDELEVVDTYNMSKADRKSLKRKKRKLRKRLRSAQYDEWQHIRATNPYARNSYSNPYGYGRYYSPYFYRPVPRRVYVIRRGR